MAVCDVDPSSRLTPCLNARAIPAVPCSYRLPRYARRPIPNLTLVAIATRERHAWFHNALTCIDAGLHVVVEKPVAPCLWPTLTPLCSAAQRRDVRVAVSACHQNRFNAAVQAVAACPGDGPFRRCFPTAASSGALESRRGLLRSGVLGAGTWDQDGGCLMNQCIHGVDLLRWMMGGEVVSVYAQTRQRFHDYLEAEDVGVAVVTFADGVGGHRGGHLQRVPEKPRGDAVPVRRVTARPSSAGRSTDDDRRLGFRRPSRRAANYGWRLERAHLQRLRQRPRPALRRRGRRDRERPRALRGRRGPAATLWRWCSPSTRASSPACLCGCRWETSVPSI